MTPKKAILAECKACWNGEQAAHEKCKSKECKLNNYDIKSFTKRIKAHCISCVPEQSIYGVKACEETKCKLFQYRLGKNPRRQRAGRSQTTGKRHFSG